MKNVFKFGFLALAISLSVAACGGNKETSSTDSTSTTIDSTITVDSAATDTVVKDTTVKM
jgi:ABC-type glycerol-3-phosphate transport system substrate-binding protein